MGAGGLAGVRIETLAEIGYPARQTAKVRVLGIRTCRNTLICTVPPGDKPWSPQRAQRLDQLVAQRQALLFGEKGTKLHLAWAA